MGHLPDNSAMRDKLKTEIEKLEELSAPTVKKPTLPSVKLDEIEYTAPSDEYLELAAEKSLAGYRNDGEKAVREGIDATRKTLEDKKYAYEQNRALDQKTAESNYKKSAAALDGDAIKRGLARSSVAAVNRAELEKEYLAANAEIADGYGKRIADLDAEIASLDGKMKTALNDFNLSYATRLGDKIAELKSERDKKIVEVAKFNNGVRKDAAELEAKRAKTESELYSAELERAAKYSDVDGLSPEKRDELYKSVYGVMDEYLGSMEPLQAKRELLNHTLYREHLSNYYYTKLLDKYGR